VTALEVGEVDEIADFYLPKTDVDRLRRNTNIRIRLGQPIPSMGFMFINMKRPPLDNVKVRHALAHAINRVQIVTQAMGNLARPARGPFGDGFKWAFSSDGDYNKLYPFNVERPTRCSTRPASRAAPAANAPFDCGWSTMPPARRWWRPLQSYATTSAP